MLTVRKRKRRLRVRQRSSMVVYSVCDSTFVLEYFTVKITYFSGSFLRLSLVGR